MLMLTRQAICSGAYLDSFESLPALWTMEQIECSLAQTMTLRPMDAADVWIFAYGSLMWNPMLQFECRTVATLHDWHRSFCLHMVAGRATPDRPGRMLALEPGGHTHGVALRLCPRTQNEDLRVVWIREMILGSYRPTWAPVTLDDGTETHAIAFVADETREQFAPDSAIATIAPLIASAVGKLGTNAEYVFRLRAALHECRVHDPYIEMLASEVERLPHSHCAV
jgi:glutathione-specific gamma-glutamylcyclotransferase